MRLAQAYRRLARIHHPDKGGDAAQFAVILHAFETLSDPQKRAVYDRWAKELEFRYVRGVAPRVCRLASQPSPACRSYIAR